MKRILILMVVVMLLCGCSGDDEALNSVYDLRTKLQSSSECAFDVDITADYLDRQYEFSMQCKYDSKGNMRFTVISPDTIAGISGIITDREGNLTFDDKLLAFDLLADGQVSPVSAPWLFLRGLCSGYINSCAELDEGIQIHVDDSYEDDALRIVIQTDVNILPEKAELFWQGRRVVCLEFHDFRIV